MVIVSLELAPRILTVAMSCQILSTPHSRLFGGGEREGHIFPYMTLIKLLELLVILFVSLDCSSERAGNALIFAVLVFQLIASFFGT